MKRKTRQPWVAGGRQPIPAVERRKYDEAVAALKQTKAELIDARRALDDANSACDAYRDERDNAVANAKAAIADLTTQRDAAEIRAAQVEEISDGRMRLASSLLRSLEAAIALTTEAP